MPYEMIDGTIPAWGVHEEKTKEQIRTCAKKAYKTALMADGHVGYGVPIGGVVAYENAISPSGVGFDIGCGNKAVRLGVKGADILHNVKRFIDEIWNTISFGVGQKNDVTVDHELFNSDTWKLPAVHSLKRMASQQLGTIGSGNHYVDIFVDENDDVWIGVHFGSRGLGHKTATHFLKEAGAKDGMMVEPCVLETGTALGDDYIACMQLAGDYAYAGRDWVCDRVAKIIGAPILEEIHNHHNYAWKETHEGKELWVVRKGATPAFPGQKGFVGGTMTEKAVILEGVDSEESKIALYSTVHGAGRVLGRMEAKGKTDRDGNVTRVGKVTPEMMAESVKNSGIELRGAGLDESEFCYKRLPEVLAFHQPSIKILHTLTPLAVAMAGAKEFDPYKD